jgi:protein involved in polysaccharide export with SLBB domain
LARTTVAIAAFIALCAAPAAASVHPGDKLDITVYNHTDLSVQPTVDSSGRIDVPLAGRVDTSKLEPAGVARAIAARLRSYIPKVAVDVRVLQQAQSIFVAGGPGGVLAYAPGETLIAALSQVPRDSAASATPGTQPSPLAQAGTADLAHGRINLHDVSIVRDGATMGPYDAATMISRGDPGPALHPGDTLKLVDKPVHVYVRGEVKQPGVTYLDKNESLAQAISQAGGDSADAWTTRVTLQRAGSTQTVALGGPEFASPAQDGDIVVVPRAPRVGVIGMVDKPGDVMLRGDPSLLSAIYQAGGPNKWGDIRHVAVMHAGARTEYDITALSHGARNENPTLADGDTVFVPEGHKVDFQAVFSALSLRWLFR